MLGHVGELCVLGMMVGLATGVTHLNVTNTIIALILVGLGLIPSKKPEQDPTKSKRFQVSFLLCLLVLVSSMQDKLMSGSAYLLLWVPGCVLFAVGLVRLLRNKQNRNKGTHDGLDWLLAAVVAFFACLLTAASARMVLAYRSTMPIAPGKLTFLPVMLIVGIGWFGLVVHLENITPSNKSTMRAWFWKRRYFGAILVVVGTVWIRSLLSKIDF